MARKKKNGGNQDAQLQKLILITAVLNMVKALIDIIKSLT